MEGAEGVKVEDGAWGKQRREWSGWVGRVQASRQGHSRTWQGRGTGVGGGVAWLVVRARRHLGLVAQPAVQPLAEAGRDEEHVRARLGRTLETVLLEANVHLHVRG